MPPRQPPDWKPWCGLAAVWLLLNVWVNADFPASTALGRWCMPSWEVAVLLLAAAAGVSAGRRVPAWVDWGVVATLLLVRVFQVVDGCYVRYFSRQFRAALDAPLLPGVVNLLIITDGLWSTGLALAALGCGFLVSAFLLHRLLQLMMQLLQRVLLAPAPHAEHRGFGAARFGPLGSGLFFAGVGLVPLIQRPLQQSVSARLVDEVEFAVGFPQLKRDVARRFEEHAQRVLKLPRDLGALGGRDVTFLLIESYGRGALESPKYHERVEEALGRLELQLGSGGRAVASRMLLPPSFGGGSWYAHATLSTGIKVWSPLDYNLLLHSDVKSLSRYMSDVGYTTVHVMPGTMSVWPDGEFYGFQKSLYARDFNYQGPWLNWGRFPDQLVLDQLRRRVPKDPGATFKDIKLVSSHVPWRAVPSIVEDWGRVGDGAIYHRHPTQHFEMKWSNLQNAHWPYIASILYDLEVVGQFVSKFEERDALVFVLGDHQPLREAALSEKWEVPIHVAGPPDLVERFLEHGFKPGIRPDLDTVALPMEAFLPLFLEALTE